MVQDAFVKKGVIRFCCKEKSCPIVKKVARVILNFIRVQLSLSQNAQLTVSWHYLGLESEQVQLFKVSSFITVALRS